MVGEKGPSPLREQKKSRLSQFHNHCRRQLLNVGQMMGLVLARIATFRNNEEMLIHVIFFKPKCQKPPLSFVNSCTTNLNFHSFFTKLLSHFKNKVEHQDRDQTARNVLSGYDLHSLQK